MTVWTTKHTLPSMLILLLSLFNITFAQTQPLTLDQKLDSYVQTFALAALPAPTAKNGPLYRLGQRLFYDQQLSGKGNISCHSCHALGSFTADAIPLAVGEGAFGVGIRRTQDQAAIIARHTPALFNLGLAGVPSFFWDGRVRMSAQGMVTPEAGLNGQAPELAHIASTLESLLAVQALFPMASPDEMLGQGSPLTPREAWDEVLKRVLYGRMSATYQKFLKEAYPQISDVNDFNIGHVANALAEFQRHAYLANNTPWDMYLRGNRQIMSDEMKKGAVVFFEKASCGNCHNGPHLANFGWLNVGVPQIGPGVKNGDDLGLAEHTGNPLHAYRFRTPPLRNIVLTAPYMHDGVFADLSSVVAHYENPEHSQLNFVWDGHFPNYSTALELDEREEAKQERIRLLAPNLPRQLHLTSEERTQLICFLTVALTDANYQAELLTRGVQNENPNCSPVIYYP